jgi:biopolymer transport protein TolQ
VEQEIAIAPAPVIDYSVWGLVTQADPIVKGVMLLLVFASVACWAIIFERLIRIWRLNRAMRCLTTA